MPSWFGTTRFEYAIVAVHLITGGAGFVGVNLTRSLLAMNDKVIAADDLSCGRREFLKPYASSPNFRFVQVDCAQPEALYDSIALFHDQEPITDVWHMAANSDIPAGIADPMVDLRKTFLTTFAALLVIRDLGIANLHFASSSAVYGDHADQAIDETSGPFEPISNYGAMKLASEAQIRAAVETYLHRASIFRFPNVVGVPATHGVIFDLIRKARLKPTGFAVLGDGTQRKMYLHVEDLVEAMLFIRASAKERYNVFNIGPSDGGVTVRDIAHAVRDRVAPSAAVHFGAGNRGWVGDVPRFRYATDKLAGLGWVARMSSADAIGKAVNQIAEQEATR